MQYESLSKLNYKSPHKYESAYQYRFQAPDTIRLDIKIHDMPAFIYCPKELWHNIIEIHKADKSIRAFRRSLPGVAIDQFTNRCLVDEIVLTNDIDGVSSTRREIHKVLEKLEQKNPAPRFHGLVMMYAILDRKGIDLRTCQDVRALYNELVLPEVIAEDPHDAPDGKIFRKGPVSVTSPAQKELHQDLLPESNIQSAMQYVLDLIHDESIDLFIRIAAAHYLIGYIHPFYNGNGRLSRFISSYLLTRELDPLIAYRLSYTIRENLKGYYNAFKLCNDSHSRGDIAPFIIWFSEIVMEAIHKLNSALLERFADLEHYRSIMQSNPSLSSKQMKNTTYCVLQAALFSDHGISTAELMRYTKLSRSALRVRLNRLDKMGILISRRYGKEKFYTLDIKHLSTASFAQK